MNDNFSIFGFALLGGIISGAVGVFLAWHGRKKEAENAYLMVMFSLKDEARKACIAREANHFFHSTIERVEDAVLRLHVAGPGCRSKKLLNLWNEYRILSRDALDTNKLHSENEGGLGVSSNVHAGEKSPPKPSAILSDFFRRFIQLADKNYRST